MKRTSLLKQVSILVLLLTLLFPVGALAQMYLTDVAVASSTASTEASNLLSNAGYTGVGDNLNKGTSSGYTVYLGIKYSNGFTTDAITGLLLRRSSTLSDLGDTFTYEGRTYHRAKSFGSNNQNGNLSIGCKDGLYVCLYYTRDGNTQHGVSPIMYMDGRTYDSAVNSSNNTMSNAIFVPCLYGSTLYQYYDINKDCGGKYAYIFYTVNHAHNIQISDIGYATHHAKCTLCECDVMYEPHNYECTGRDHTTHNLKCTICGYTAQRAHNIEVSNRDIATHSWTCSLCGYEVQNEAHTYEYTSQDNASHDMKCSICGYTTQGAHNYDNTIQWNWNSDHTQCQAIFHCSNCGYDASLDAEVTHTSAEATCTQRGYESDLATCQHPITGTAVTDEKVDSIPALGHDYQDGICTRCNGLKPAQLAADGYYEIDCFAQLLWYLKQKGGTNWRLNINGRLTSDIDASGHDASLYPSDRSLDQGYTFDGNQHTISGLTIADGLFTGNYGTIKNLGICESEMTGEAGAIAYNNRNGGTIENCFSYANKIGNGGGIVYRNAYGSKMSGCWSAGVSKLCAYNFGSVSNSYAYAASDAHEVTNGALCYALCQNGSDVWRQTLGSDLRPVWNSTHAVVYKTTPCISYNNSGQTALEHNCDEANLVTDCMMGDYTILHCTQCLEDIRTGVGEPQGHHFEQGVCTRCQLAAPHNPLCFTAGEDQATVCFTKVGSPNAVSLMYSTNGTDWYPYTIGTTLTLNSQGDKVYMTALGKNETFTKDYDNYYQYVLQKSIAASGDVTTLLDTGGTLTLPAYAFSTLFYKCTSLTQAPELPATTLAEACYYMMFMGCTSLTQAPVLPATTLAMLCYMTMFADCISLTQTPKLPATTLKTKCYYGMFKGCTALTQASKLPATTLAPACYYKMFNGCTSLTQAPPELPATTMAQSSCESMFQGCTSLTQAPELPATTMAIYCYENMFNGCTSLTQAPPELPATTMAQSCCESMFERCKSLTQAPKINATTMASKCCYNMFKDCFSLTQAPPELPATTMAESCCESMFERCISLVIAPKIAATTLASKCCYNMFNYCLSLTQAPPELPATTLAESCYESMFQDCASLVKAPKLNATTMASKCCYKMFCGCGALIQAPELPATTLADECYTLMFGGCTSLIQAPELPATTLTNGCYNTMFRDCSSLRSLTVYFTQWEGHTSAAWLAGAGNNQSILFCPEDFEEPYRDNTTIPEHWTVVRGTRGDLNKDGAYTVDDITLLLDYILNNKNTQPTPDVNNDGVVNVDDVNLLERIVLMQNKQK